MKGPVAGLVVLVAGVAVAAEGFVPGKSLDPVAYSKLVQELSEASAAVREADRGRAPQSDDLGKNVRTKLDAMNAAVDAETRPAMAAVFADPTAVYFHKYTKPGTRPNTKDGADGLRVVWEREIDVDGGKRLMTVITFWEFDAKSGTMKMRTGEDSIRVRVELAGEDVPLFKRFAGLSYTTKADASGNIVSVEPGVYVDESGKLREGLAHQAMPSDCSGCHSSGRRKNFDEKQYDTRNSSDYAWMLESLAKEGVGPDAIAALERLKDDPRKNFLPPGLRDALADAPGDVAAMGLVMLTGDELRPLHHWNGDRADRTRPVNGPPPALTKPAQGAGKKNALGRD